MGGTAADNREKTTMRLKHLIAGVAMAAIATVAEAAEFKPAVIFDMGGKFDKSFNEGVWTGVQKFMEETGVEVMEFEVTNETQREQAMRRMVSRGATVVLGVGFAQADAIDKVASENPDTKFAIIDVFWLDRPNLRQYQFKEHEGSYLVGVAAALTSKTGTVGFVGGMDIPLIRKFACGYAQGAKEAKAGTQVIQNMTGTTPAAWNDPTKGAELAQSQIDRGADVIYQAAGGTGLGVIRAAADAGKLAIGVDSNQNGLAPGSVLTSMLKRVDVAAYQTLKDAMDGTFTAGVVSLGLAEDGIDWAQDEHNAALVSDAVRAAVEKAKAEIISGAISVHDYESDSSCPF
jgi:basic membrane protein A